jgi:hypothetical protein
VIVVLSFSLTKEASKVMLVMCLKCFWKFKGSNRFYAVLIIPKLMGKLRGGLIFMGIIELGTLVWRC